MGIVRQGRQPAGRGFALKRRETENPPRIRPEHEIHEPVAQAAHAVEKDDGVLSGRRSFRDGLKVG
jgi:hypothetical protein